MKSVCLTSLLFTLESVEVGSNGYVAIFLMYLASLVKSGGLTSADCFTLLIDKRTLDFINESIFGAIFQRLPCEKRIIHFDAPKTMLEGMVRKYTDFEYTQDDYMYLDIDTFVVQDIHRLLKDMPSNTIRIRMEGLLKDDNYGASMPRDYDFGTELGYSAGTFACGSKAILTKFFNSVRGCIRDDIHYCVEQPYFNQSISLSKKYLNYDTFDNSMISFNGHKYIKGYSVIIDCAGEPGNGKIHFQKAMNVFSLIHSGYF